MVFYAFFRKGVNIMYEVFEMLLGARGVNVADVSKATGISQSTLSNWKKRRNKLSADNAAKIANFFGVSIDYLMGNVQTDGQEDGYYKDELSRMIADEMYEDRMLRALHHIKKNISHEQIQAYYDMLVKLYRIECPGDDYDFDIEQPPE